jgi:hypothetical protein
MKQKLKDPISQVTPAMGTLRSVRREPTQEEIAARARSLWDLSGRPENRDLSFWLQAERTLRQESDGDDADKIVSHDTSDLLGEPSGSIEERLSSFGNQGGRETTSL